MNWINSFIDSISSALYFVSYAVGYHSERAEPKRFVDAPFIVYTTITIPDSNFYKDYKL